MSECEAPGKIFTPPRFRVVSSLFCLVVCIEHVYFYFQSHLPFVFKSITVFWLFFSAITNRSQQLIDNNERKKKRSLLRNVMCNTFVERYALSSPVFQKVGTRKSVIAYDFYVRNNWKGANRSYRSWYAELTPKNKTNKKKKAQCRSTYCDNFYYFVLN